MTEVKFSNTCKNGCPKVVVGRKMCNPCYRKFMKKNPNIERLNQGKGRTKAKCHPERKHQARGLCSMCYNRDRLKNEPGFREKKAKYAKEYRKKNLEKMKLQHADNMLKKRYGITLSEYNQLWEQQSRCCKICFKKNENSRRFPLDHCHKTRKVRGIICNLCNAFMGYVDKDINILKRMEDYKNGN